MHEKIQLANGKPLPIILVANKVIMTKIHEKQIWLKSVDLLMSLLLLGLCNDSINIYLSDRLGAYVVRR